MADIKFNSFQDALDAITDYASDVSDNNWMRYHERYEAAVKELKLAWDLLQVTRQIAQK